MAFFLKKSTKKNRTYLAIYESFYNPTKKQTAHRTYKSLGSIETLIEQGINDPISKFQKEVDQLNLDLKTQKDLKVSDVSPEVYLGYFPIKSIINKLDVKKYIEYFNKYNNFDFDLYQLITSLIYARSVNPCSKNKTFHQVLPNLLESHDYSYDQLLTGLEFIGNNYNKFIEIFTTQLKSKYQLNTKTTYFDCTNFYFEIDRQDDFRKPGPSKENQTSPIVGLGLLLDSNQIPIGMKMYPGNQSEKPVIREIIDDLKKQNNVSGKTILVADKGLNCAENIAFARENNDGYIFSKSVKTLPASEKEWVLLDKDYKTVYDENKKIKYKYKSCVDKFPYTIDFGGIKKKVLLTEKRLLSYNPDLAAKKRYEINKMVEKVKSLTYSQAKKSEYGVNSKYVNFVDEDGVKASTIINQDAIDKDLLLAGYNLIVTSEIDMDDQDLYNVYHNLWRIEESFKIMKSDLDARPVFLQKEGSIKGHFLICYLTVLLERIFQFYTLKNNYSSSEIYKFIKQFRAVKIESRYINLTTMSKFLNDLSNIFDLPLTNYFLSEPQIKSIINYKIKSKY